MTTVSTCICSRLTRVSKDTETILSRWVPGATPRFSSLAAELMMQTVKQNQAEYGLPLKILSYDELYGWTMDRVVDQVGKKNNCTFCGVFRRQALDRGAAELGIEHIVTGHNADDIAETVLMNSEYFSTFSAARVFTSS